MSKLGTLSIERWRDEQGIWREKVTSEKEGETQDEHR
jgi:hypothetical protein